MKKTACTLLILAGALGLILSACGSPQTGAKVFDPATTAQALLDSSAFSEALEPLDATLIYDQLDGDALTGSAVYASTGATAEEIAVLSLTDEDAAKAALAVLQGRVDSQKEVLRDYQPNEISKLDKAILERRGSTVLLVVAADADAAQKALDEWSK